MKRISAILTMSLLMLVSSCLKYDKEEGLQFTKTLHVSVSVDGMDSVRTKSAVTAQDATAENVNLWIYDKTGLVFDGYFTEEDIINVESLVVGMTYYVRAVANAGLIPPPETLEQADALTFDWDISNLNASAGVPMAFKETFTMSVTTSLDIHFKRTVAKYTFIINQSGFNGTYTIKSLRLCNAPSKVRAFESSSIDGYAIPAADGDYATDTDLSHLNQGEGVSFFIYENLQGDILSGNADPWKKEFENYNTEKATFAAKCTYLEVRGDYATTGVSVKDLKYRIYLGSNATTNFDVTRNTAYTVILVPTETTAIDEDLISWKVERGTITDARGLDFSPASIEVESLGQASVTVVPTPAALEYTIEEGENFSSAGLTFEQEGNCVTVRSGSIVASGITSKLVAKTLDGEKRGILVITVLPPEVITVTGYDYNDPVIELSYGDVNADGSAASPALTYSQTATKNYSDGSKDENVIMVAAGSPVPSDATVVWGGSAVNGSDGSINGINGKVSAKNRGTSDYTRGVVFNATVDVTVNGKTGSASKDVYQQANQVASTVEIDSKTEKSGWSVGTYQESGFSVPKGGGTASFKTYVYHKETVYKKYTRTWTSGSSETSDWEYASQSEPYDNVTVSSDRNWACVSPTSAGGNFKVITITVDANDGDARTATITLTNSNGNSTTRTISQEGNVFETGRDYDVQFDVNPGGGGTRAIDAGIGTEDRDYEVTISPTSKSVSVYEGSFTISTSGGYNHYTYYYKQAQQKDKYSLKDVIHYSDGSTSDTNIRTDQTGDWYNVGSPYVDDSKTECEPKTGTPTLGSNQAWMRTDGSYDANSSPSSRTARITASLGTASDELVVTQDANEVTSTEPATEEKSASASTENTDYWVTINGETSPVVTVPYTSGTISPLVIEAGHIHTEQPRKQVRTGTKYYWKVGDPTYGGWSSWSTVNDGEPTITYPSDTPTLSKTGTWLQTSGSYTANSSSLSRSGSIKATNNKAVATLSVTQEGKPSYSISVNPTSLTFDADASGSGSGQNVSVTCPYGEWEVSSTPSGWTATKSGNTLTIYPNAANSSTTVSKTATVKVRCTESTTVTASVSVKQEKKVVHTLTAEWVGSNPIYMNNTYCEGRKYKVYYDGNDVTSQATGTASGAMTVAAGGSTYWNNVGSGNVYFSYDGLTSNTLTGTSESIVDFVEIRLANWSADDDDPGVNPKFQINNGKIANGGITSNGFHCNGAMYGRITYSIHLDVYAHYKTDSKTITSATHEVGMIDYEVDMMKGDSDYWTELDIPDPQRGVLNSLWVTFSWQGIAD